MITLRVFRTARWVASDATFPRAHDHEARATRAVRKSMK
jgi:hypothetical protein